MSLTKHLELQQQAIVQLVELLERERRALAQARVDGEKLRELTACKQAALQKLPWSQRGAQSGSRRRLPGDLAAVAGVGASGQGDQCLERRGAQPAHGM